jgi:hypothetical protein
MMVTMAYPRLRMMRHVKYECTWIDNRRKMVADFEDELLQPVYADGSPRTCIDTERDVAFWCKASV